MTRADDDRVADILAAADGLARRLTMTFETWQDDEDLQLVTERLVEIVGEACRALTAEFRAELDEIDWPGFIGLRNVLVRAYHRIQRDLLWEAATTDVPRLAAVLRRLVKGSHAT